jgi:phenylalanyl-tRNA synthetase beta chain
MRPAPSRWRRDRRRDSAIGEKTTRVVLESANFQASSIRKTSVAIKLRTDASMRFEKAQDPANTVRGLARAIELLREISPGIRLVGGVADQMREMIRAAGHRTSARLAGAQAGPRGRTRRGARILESLEFGVTEPRAGRLLRDRAPVARHQGRCHQGRPGGRGGPHGGLRFHHAAGAAGARRRAARQSRAPFQHEVRNIFVDKGFTEVYNYSFLSEESVRAFGFDPAAHMSASPTPSPAIRR